MSGEKNEIIAEYLEEELLPIRKEEKERIIYYHDCKSMECNVLKDNKEPCRFCGTEKWEIYKWEPKALLNTKTNN